MAADQAIRQYVVLKATERLLKGDKTIDEIQQFLAEILFNDRERPKVLPFSVLSFEPWHLELEESSGLDLLPPDRFAIGLELRGDALRLLREVKNDIFLGAGANLPMRSAEHWCPRYASDPIFGTRAEARRLMGVDFLKQRGATGQNVNVVVVDRGVDKRHIKFGGGWTRRGLPKPGQTPGGHGMMIVRNILDIAPDATIFDCPMLADLPGHISNIPRSLDDAHGAYSQMIHDIAQLRQQARWSGPWVFVNAWAVYDRRSENPIGDYTNRPDHPFNQDVARGVSQGIDIVFCAGNCGEFCPDPFCGPNDRGAGQSILGANSHPDVITTGAVRTDTIWLGYSSQGPGQPRLDPDKPDFCAPSQFCEDDDAHATNTGTSAACALTAGMVAALRSMPGLATLPARDLKTLLKNSARKTETGQGWKYRLGSGILNAEAACKEFVAR